MWQPNVRHIQPLEPVTAGVASRPDQDLEQRTNYLKMRLDEAELGQAVYAHQVTLDSSTLVGHAVYWNASRQCFAPALASVEWEANSGVMQNSPRSEVLGIVARKDTATSGSVLLFGFAKLNLTPVVDGSGGAGRYYLSEQTPGKLTRTRGQQGISVLYADGSGGVFVHPQWRNLAEDHVHYRFDLVTRPAGDSPVPSPGERHTITDPDPSLPGWLPARHPIFGGRAPRQAAWGYNLARHPNLARVWPPPWLSGVQVVWDRGEGLGGTLVPLGPQGLLVVDRHGLWWMSDCYGDVPWPLQSFVFGSSSSASLSDSYSSSLSSLSSAPECPRSESMQLTLYFVQPAADTAWSGVRSLRPWPGSPLRFVDCDGRPAERGELFAQLEQPYRVIDDDTVGNLVVKEVQGNQLHRGYVVQGVRSLSPQLVVQGTRSKVLGGQTFYQGLLELSLNSDNYLRDLPVQIVRLDDVHERHYQDVLYLGFPPGRTSRIRCKLRLPQQGLPSSPVLRFRLLLLGRVSGNLPNLTLTCRRVPRPAPSAVVPLPLTDTPVALTTTRTVSADHYTEFESAAVSVAAGDTLFWTLTRGTDSYAGEIGLLDVLGVVASA